MSGQFPPYTGAYFPSAFARAATVTILSSGVVGTTNVYLCYQSPFDGVTPVPFAIIPIATGGYFQSGINRAIGNVCAMTSGLAGGSGSFWIAFTQQS